VEDAVKPSTGRREHKALLTRHRILDAAEVLFVRDGYTATTIAAIAQEADVAVQTVYAVFRNKRAILQELLAVRVLDDDEAIPQRFPARVHTRDDWLALEREPDPRRQLGLLAAVATHIGSRIAGIYQVLAGAAGSDREIAVLYRDQQQARYKDQQRLARSLGRKGALRAGLSEKKATDIMWAIATPNTYHALVVERGWSKQDYEQFLAETLSSALLTGDPGCRVKPLQPSHPGAPGEAPDL
jgi:AcrR family transcriptional regulator